MEIESAIRDFIIRELMFDEEVTMLDDDESLFARRAIDSIGLLRLVAFLEETYGVEILDDEMVPENLESIRSIGALVRRKQAPGSL